MGEGVCNAIMDTLDHHSGKSIFPKTLWWNSSQGWRNKYIDRDSTKGRVQWRWVSWITFGKFSMNKPVQLTDAWHFFKMLGIICWMTSTVISPIVLILFLKYGMFDDVMLYGIMFGVLTVLGLIRNNTFTLFYKKLLLK